MSTHTVFCRQSNNIGTTWIGSVEADTTTQAIEKGRSDCARDWCCILDDVFVIGVAAGEVDIRHWQDMNERH